MARLHGLMEARTERLRDEATRAALAAHAPEKIKDAFPDAPMAPTGKAGRWWEVG